jgi:C4-dicarboxylate-specific signal transduction histidine kinase
MSQGSGGMAALTAGQLGQLNRLATSARLVAGLAHELNNSLQVVSGLVELLADHTEVAPDVAARIRKIGAQADKATSTIRQVLGYTREGVAEQPRADVAAAVERALTLRRYNLGRAGIAVTSQVPAGLAVRAEERGLVQIVLNLVLNAEDALAAQARKDLHIVGDLVAGRVRVTVSDTGHGVGDDIRDRIFEPFFTTRTDARAVGLGLPVAAEMATGYGGSLVLADGTAGSTTFVVELPAAG